MGECRFRLLSSACACAFACACACAGPCACPCPCALVCVPHKQKNSIVKCIQAAMQLDCSNGFEIAPKSFPTLFLALGKTDWEKMIGNIENVMGIT